MNSEGPAPDRRGEQVDSLLWHALVGALPDYAWLKGPDGRYIDCNEAFARHFGRSREAVRGLADVELTDAASAAAFVDSDALALALPPGQPLRREERMQLPDGRSDTVELTKLAVRDAAGQPLAVIGLGRAVGLARRAQELQAEAQAAANAMQLAQAQAELLSRMSHELRTPLNAVIGFTQLMRMAQAQGRPPRADYLALVDGAARQLLALIEDALQLRAVAAPRTVLQPRELGLHAAVAEALDLLAPLALERAVVVSNEVDATLRATCDASALRQVLVNLCSNAIRFNRPAGTVRVFAEPAAAAGETLVLHVQDSGDGLEETQLARLFQPFERLGRLPGVDAGSGLGLVIARALAQAMGGSLELTSRRGVGTTATLRLPR